MAELATGNADESLDIVQEAMLKLVKRYRSRDPEEWGPLFQRILQNGITDWHRRNSLRRRFRTWLGHESDDSADAADPMQNVADPGANQPDRQVRDADALQALEDALAKLPLRQRQAFLLRAWEGFDVNTTASAMGCSTGSVKTHYFRAIQTLRNTLGEHWP